MITQVLFTIDEVATNCLVLMLKRTGFGKIDSAQEIF